MFFERPITRWWAVAGAAGLTLAAILLVYPYKMRRPRLLGRAGALAAPGGEPELCVDAGPRAQRDDRLRRRCRSWSSCCRACSRGERVRSLRSSPCCSSSGASPARCRPRARRTPSPRRSPRTSTRRSTGSTARPAGRRRSTSGSGSPTTTGSGRWSSGTGRSSTSGRPTAARRGLGRRCRPDLVDAATGEITQPPTAVEYVVVDPGIDIVGDARREPCALRGRDEDVLAARQDRAAASASELDARRHAGRVGGRPDRLHAVHDAGEPAGVRGRPGPPPRLGRKDKPKGGSRVVIRVGELVRKDKQPALGRSHGTLHVQDQPARGPHLPAADSAAAVPRRRQDRPHLRAARASTRRDPDTRELGAQVGYSFSPAAERAGGSPRLRCRAARARPLSRSQSRPEAPPRDAVDLDARDHTRLVVDLRSARSGSRACRGRISRSSA